MTRPTRIAVVCRGGGRMADGSRIEIEEQPAEEVTGYRGTRWVPAGVRMRNPAFDVMPAGLITGIVIERGVVLHPDARSLAALAAGR